MKIKMTFRPAVFLCSTALLALAAVPGFGQDTGLLGFGARARALGGAFVAVADDLSAIYWNPAGLALFGRPAAGLSASGSLRSATYVQKVYEPGLGNIDYLNAGSADGVRFGGLAAGCWPLGKRWVAGLGVYAPAGFGINWRSADMAPVSSADTNIRWTGSAAAVTIAPAIAREIFKGFSIGAAALIELSRFGFDRYAGSFLAPLPDPPYMEPIDLGQYEETLTGRAVSAQLGLLYRPSARLSFGLSVRTACRVAFRGTAKVAGFPALSAFLNREIAGSSGVKKTVTWPARLDAGAAFRPTKNLLLTAAVQWTPWSRIGNVHTTYLDPNWASYMGERGNTEMPMFNRDAVLVRFGAEYALGMLALRGGFFADAAPAPDSGVNLLFPRPDALGIGLGAGFPWAGFQVDVVLEYTAPKNAGSVLSMASVYPPSSGTIWELSLPGEYSARTLHLGISIGRAF